MKEQTGKWVLLTVFVTLAVVLLILPSTLAATVTGGRSNGLKSRPVIPEHRRFLPAGIQRRGGSPVVPPFVQVQEPLQQREGHDAPSVSREQTLHDSPAPGPVKAASGYILVEEQLTYTPEHDEKLSPLVLREEKSPKKATDPKVLPLQKTHKMSPRLPSKRLQNGVSICQTPECSAAAAKLVESLDITTRPCDDFYQFACGGWINNHPLPVTGSITSIGEVAALTNVRLHYLVESPTPAGAPEPLRMYRDLYSTCMDTNQTDSLGLTPLVEELAKQGGWPMTLDTWSETSFNFYDSVNHARDINVSPILSVGIDLDTKNTSRYILYIDAGNVPLGYARMQNAGENILGPYRTYITEAAKLVRASQGSSVTDVDIAIQVEELIAFEVAFSKLIKTGADTTLNPSWYTTVANLQAAVDSGTPGVFDWLAFFGSMFSGTGVVIDGTEPVISVDSQFWSGLSTLLANTTARTMANYLAWNFVYDLAGKTTYAMQSLKDTFSQQVATVEFTGPRTLFCQLQVEANLGFALSRDYVDLYLPASAKPEVTELVEDIRAAYRVLMQGNTWMLPEDLVVAIEKLNAIDPFVAYPDWIMNDAQLIAGYEGLVITKGEYLKDIINLGNWYDFNSLAELKTTPVHSFILPPTIVNAFYNPPENTITILAGILQTPLYAHNSLAAINYGAIGMVIGHEMTHGFDNTGRLYDKNGNLVQWWSNETIVAYEQKAQCFVNQYDSYIPPEVSAIGLSVSVNGLRTEGENIADNGGIREAFQAYQLYVARYGEEPRLPGLDEFTPDQLFYLGYANVWCENKDAANILTQIASDPHSPGRFRVLGPLQNDAEFSRVWNCPAGAPMNRGPESCLLW